jgi:hypothetical protein
MQISPSICNNIAYLKDIVENLNKAGVPDCIVRHNAAGIESSITGARIIKVDGRAYR